MSSPLENLMEMGFSRDKAQRALKRANNDVGQATNFLVEPDDEDDSEVPDLLPATNFLESSQHPPSIRGGDSFYSGTPIGIPVIPTNAPLSYANPTVPTAEQIYPAGSAFGGKSILSGHLPVVQPATWGSEATVIDKAGKAHTGSTEDQQLQEALALSLKEQTQAIPLPDSSSRFQMSGVSKEDEEMARAIEQSLQAGGGGDFGAGENVDPRTLIKADGVAVGLKNIGNTCYCNSLLQTYWAIGAFREAIIHCPVAQARGGDGLPIDRSILSSGGASATGNSKEKEDETQKKERESKAAVELVRELQRLFAYMALSNRKMVDPSAVMHAVLDSSGKHSHGLKVGNQEDVSEFNHIFLQRVQQGLSICYNSAKTQAGESTGHVNVIERLFQGKVLQDLTAVSAKGERQVVSSSTCDFFEIILHVIHKDMHAALQDYVDCVIDGYQHSQEEQSHRIEKSVWFQVLPPILTFYLNRVSFDKELKAPVKVHSQFTFPATLYMDRYLEEHRKEVTETRKEVSKLCQEIEGLEGRLKSLTHYASPDSKLTPEQAVAKEESFKAVISLLQNGSMEESRSEMEACIALLSRRLKLLVSEREELEAQLRSLVGQCDEAYQHLKKHKYSLLAVLVHDGLAASGHYWAYIKGGMSGEHVMSEAERGGSWFKYSDTHVTHVEEEEVWRMSQGGTAQASAYCLIYHTTELSQAHAEGEATPSGGIPTHLRKEVDDDNRLVEEEVKTWQRKLTVQDLSSELEKQFQELKRAHSSGSGQHDSASQCFSFEYWLLRKKEEALARHVIAARLAANLNVSSTQQAMRYAAADNQLMTLLNKASGGVMELDSAAQERLKDAETSYHIWLGAHKHVLDAELAFAQEPRDEAKAILSLAAASHLKDVHDAQLAGCVSRRLTCINFDVFLYQEAYASKKMTSPEIHQDKESTCCICL
jgi:hypothetical protein